MTRTKRSIRSQMVRAAIALLGYQREFRSGERMIRGAVERVVRPEPFAPPKALDRGVRISARRVEGWPVYTVIPKAGRSDRRVLYAHGGGWVHEISYWHWRLIAGLASATGAEFVVPIYPLAPVGTAETVVPVVAELAEELIAEVGPARVALMGDSAGGSIALAAAMLLRDRNVAAPRDVVLISPALDLSFTDPLIPRIQPKDPWLAVPGARAAAECWRGNRLISDPLVSPVHGSLDGLGRITMFSGSHDILYADALALERKARANGHPLDFHRVPNMLHVYPLLPIPEGATARRTIAEVLTR
jgi:acetyl esterase/lipase